ncbi:TrkH family potassium uptake protein [Aminicella lysinilytica]|uniref:TrkH family potassium uptake protein n=1 Tax=Aminicella lysinilytica TaxID=433323 RepID=UPI0026F1E815|nr:TrkH family potassium uptake protein [Aminicella lysinilytica]
MRRNVKLMPVQILAVGFALIIFCGGIILSLPISCRNGADLSFIDGLFTSTSATCVTGLAVVDTYSQFNFFGQLVILILIQIGGLGFMGFATVFAFAARSKITIFQRTLLQESLGSSHIGGVVKTIRRMLVGTLVIEAMGAFLISLRFVPRVGLAEGIWYGIFHSISAFCNAGFDLMGKFEPGSSITLFADDPLIEITIMALIAVGGLGFIVWSDMADHKFSFHRLSLHSKIMLTFTAALILGGALIFYIVEGNYSFRNMNTGERIMNSFFASVSPRTAGFNSVQYADMSTAGRFLTMMLMFIGAGPGSTGGGIKVTTFVTLMLSIYSNAKNYNDLSIFKRRLPADAQRKALSTIASYIFLVICCTFLLLMLNPELTSESCFFESLSAMGTVGLTMGITSGLGTVSELCLMFLMYCGRLGSIAVAMAIVRKKVIPKISYPEEKITLG